MFVKKERVRWLWWSVLLSSLVCPLSVCVFASFFFRFLRIWGQIFLGLPFLGWECLHLQQGVDISPPKSAWEVGMNA